MNALRGKPIDFASNPWFRPQQAGSGSHTMGDGTGQGFMSWEQLPGMAQYITRNTGTAGESNPNDTTVDPERYFADNNYSLMQAHGGGGDWRYAQDAQGNMIGSPQFADYGDDQFGIAAALASLVVGGAAAGMGGGGSAAAGAAGAGEGIGTLGSIAAGSGEVGALSTMGQIGAAETGLAGLQAASAGVPQLATVGGGIGTLGTMPALSAPVGSLSTMGLATGAEGALAGMTFPQLGTVTGGAALGGAAGAGAAGGGGSSGALQTMGQYSGSPTASLSGVSAPSTTATVTGGGMGGWGNIGQGVSDVFTGNASAGTYGNLLQAGLGLYGTNKAAGAMQDGVNSSNALLKSMYDQNRADNQPLLDLRNQTLPKINALMSNPSSITSQPGYQFGLNQGQTQIDNKAAAAGGYYSGAQLKASQRYGQDYAGSKLDDSLNRLMGVAGLGQVGGTMNQQSSNNYGNQASGNALMGGQIRGSSYLGGANIAGNAIGNMFNADQDYRVRRGGPW